MDSFSIRISASAQDCEPSAEFQITLKSLTQVYQEFHAVITDYDLQTKQLAVTVALVVTTGNDGQGFKC
jgi:hypothetical protein